MQNNLQRVKVYNANGGANLEWREKCSKCGGYFELGTTEATDEKDRRGSQAYKCKGGCK